MVRAWYHDGQTTDPRAPHMETPGQYLSVQQLYKEIGVEVLRFEPDTLDTHPDYIDLKKKRGFDVEDYIIISDDYIDIASKIEADYDKRMKIFNTEHMHPDEEIRFVTAGSAYFDMRSRDDRWIRLELGQGDLIIIPGGVFHRFFLNDTGYIKLRRLFSEVVSWVAYNRADAVDTGSHSSGPSYRQETAVY